VIDAIWSDQVKPSDTILADVQVAPAQIEDGPAARFIPPNRQWLAYCPHTKLSPGRTTIVVLLCGVAVVLNSRSTTATIIVGFRTPTEIVLGADSKILIEPGHIPAPNACKIARLNERIFIVASGRLSSQTFSVRDLAIDGFRSHGSVLDKIQMTEAFIRDRLAIERSHIGRWQRPLVGIAVTNVAFFGIEGGVPMVRIRQFTTTADVTRIAIVHNRECPPNCDAGMFAVFFGDAEGVVLRYVVAHPAYFRRAMDRPNVGLPGAIRKLIKMAIVARPDICGRPISIVRTAIGRPPEWIQRGRECANQ
jgi:hypothetical protein